ncbi:MAG: hypothetical protein IJU79_04525 [Desulfovibrionaceae bacterium]|nr:hypothetical protein [Desulfovibrionaceae bacterium]
MLQRTLLGLCCLFYCLLSTPGIQALAQPINPAQLQGSWAGSNGRDTMLLMFRGNMCALGLNGQQISGTWSLQGNTLVLQMQNGKRVTYRVQLQGTSLVLDGSVYLQRQGAPKDSGFGPGSGWEHLQKPQGGSWGNPQPGAPQGGSWGNPQPGAPQGGVWGFPPQGAPQGGSWGNPQPSAPQGGSWGNPQPGAPQGGVWGFPPQGSQQSGSWGTPPQNAQTVLEGTWEAQLPQGRRILKIQGNQYAQLFNGQVQDAGTFSITPDGRFNYRVTSGQFVGQQGENRYSLQGNRLTMYWPDGNHQTFIRVTPQSWPGVSQGQTTPLEGRWVWAKQGPVSFGFVFRGNTFSSFWNNAPNGRGTFTLTPNRIILKHEEGPTAGHVDNLGYQLHGDRLLIFVQPDADPIPYVRR